MEVLTKSREELKPLIEVDKRAVLLLSGGTDSTTLLYDLVSQGYEVKPISFIYGQRHKKEVQNALATCSKLGLGLEVVDISIFGQLAPSSLTSRGKDIPKGGYEDGNMRSTVVPNRNMVLLSIATSYALGLRIDNVFYAAHSGDHAIYPDCRPAFILALGKALKLCDYIRVNLETPYMYWEKSDIIRRGIGLGVDYSLTWSCYEGGEKACGKCGTCIERLEAFKKVGIKDPLEYKED